MKRQKALVRTIHIGVWLMGIGLSLIWGAVAAQAGQPRNLPPTGKKYGFLVGINTYPYLPKRSLQGCVNDMWAFNNLLEGRFGFARQNIKTLTNDQATRDAMLRQLKSYSDVVRTGDLLVFAFFGHGTLFPDAASEVQDETKEITPDCEQPPDCCPKGRYDSAICPYDTGDPRQKAGNPWKNLILDDELYEVFSEITQKGCLAVFISDSCHSGTLARSMKAQTRSIPPTAAIRVSCQQITPNQSRAAKTFQPISNYIVITSSKDEESSVELDNGKGVSRGLFSFAFEQLLLHEGGSLTYRTVMEKITPRINQAAKNIKGQLFGQSPQLETHYCRPEILDGPLFALPPAPKPPATNSAFRFVAQVLNHQGNPLEGATVSVLKPEAPFSNANPNHQILIRGTTNSKGVFDSTGPLAKIGGVVQKGSYRVTVVCPGYQSYDERLQLAENVPGKAVYTFRLVPVQSNPIIEEKNAGVRFVAQVLDTQGRPLVGAIVRVSAPNTFQHQNGGWLLQGKTNSRGVFDSTGNLSQGRQLVQPGRYLIIVSCTGFQAFQDMVSLVEVRKGIAVYTFHLVPER